MLYEVGYELILVLLGVIAVGFGVLGFKKCLIKIVDK